MAGASALGAAGEARSRRTAWLLFAPLAAVVGLRWVLTWLDDRASAPPAWPLRVFAGAQDPWAWLAPTAAVLLVLAAVLLLARLAWRSGARRAVLRCAAAAWLLLCLAACGAQLQRHLNQARLQPQPPVAAQVLGTHFQPPSLRSTGGTLLVLRVDGLAAPQQVLVDAPAAAGLQVGQPLRLAWARGRWQGRFVTGWQVDAVPAPAAPRG